jgi:hypothetical protein
VRDRVCARATDATFNWTYDALVGFTIVTEINRPYMVRAQCRVV